MISIVFLDLENEFKQYFIFGSLGVIALLTTIHILTAQKAKCIVCGAKQFTPKRNVLHRRASQWPLIGTLVPTAVHALFLRWFRCRDCGTSNRLVD